MILSGPDQFRCSHGRVCVYGRYAPGLDLEWGVSFPRKNWSIHFVEDFRIDWEKRGLTSENEIGKL